jgi:hypothetical protein
MRLFLFLLYAFTNRVSSLLGLYCVSVFQPKENRSKNMERFLMAIAYPSFLIFSRARSRRYDSQAVANKGKSALEYTL